MTMYSIQKTSLLPISVSEIKLEKEIQILTEENIKTILGLTFVSGKLNQEFKVRSMDQDFYIDTLAFDEEQKSLTLIEYKKDKNTSVIDQGFAYLSAMLNQKAEFVLELNKRLHKNFAKSDINWEQSRVIFISSEFTNYQRNAINFKDLPIRLYEVRRYDNESIEYLEIKPHRISESIGSLSKNKIIQKVSKEVKVYTVEDLVKNSWIDTRALLQEFEEGLTTLKKALTVRYNKQYIAYVSMYGRNFVEVVPQQQGLKIYFRFPINYLESHLTLEDCSKIGHWTNGDSFALITNSDQIPEAIRLSGESFNYLHRDKKT